MDPIVVMTYIYFILLAVLVFVFLGRLVYMGYKHALITDCSTPNLQPDEAEESIEDEAEESLEDEAENWWDILPLVRHTCPECNQNPYVYNFFNNQDNKMCLPCFVDGGYTLSIDHDLAPLVASYRDDMNLRAQLQRDLLDSAVYKCRLCSQIKPLYNFFPSRPNDVFCRECYEEVKDAAIEMEGVGFVNDEGVRFIQSGGGYKRRNRRRRRRGRGRRHTRTRTRSQSMQTLKTKFVSRK